MFFFYLAQTLKGKVVKALDNLYHPGCFVCFNCSSSLSGTLLIHLFVVPDGLVVCRADVLLVFYSPESFFEHDGQAVCAKCKHSAITLEEPVVP